jgi:homoaconitase/3-isopropylmalate dehydratase large subunit
MKRPPNPVSPDVDAAYEAIYYLDVTDMPPYIVKPHDPGNSVSISEVEPQQVKIDHIGNLVNLYNKEG